MSPNWLLPLGNDIVDLALASTHRPTYYVRQQKVSFHPEELERLSGVDHYFWLLWTMKESAFKAVVQAGRNEIRFNPADFILKEFENLGQRCNYAIVCDDYLFHGQSVIESDFIHSISYSQGHIFKDSVTQLSLSSYANQSLTTREMAIDAFSGYHNIERSSISIRKDEYQVPYFLINGERSDFDLTLSHHGNYLAFAFSI